MVDGRWHTTLKTNRIELVLYQNTYHSIPATNIFTGAVCLPSNRIRANCHPSRGRPRHDRRRYRETDGHHWLVDAPTLFRLSEATSKPFQISRSIDHHMVYMRRCYIIRPHSRLLISDRTKIYVNDGITMLQESSTFLTLYTNKSTPIE